MEIEYSIFLINPDNSSSRALNRQAAVRNRRRIGKAYRYHEDSVYVSERE